MPLRNYNETDLVFYSKEKISNVEVTTNQEGYVIQWPKIENVSGYAIYRSNNFDNEGDLLITLEPDVQEYIDPVPLNQLYFYTVYGVNEGDIFFDETTGDLALTQDYESARQDITNRIRTIKGDWRSHPNIGADLEDLIGEPNTRETGDKGTQQIYEALTYDDRFAPSDLTIRAVPTSLYTIDYFILLDTDDNLPLIIRETLNL